MKVAELIASVFFTAVAVLCYPVAAAAQMGMFGGVDKSSQHSAQVISSGFPGASYTPFERLRHETRSARKHAFQSVEPTGESDGERARMAVADKIDTDEAKVRETAFRVRTTRVYPQPSLALATKAFQPICISAGSPREQRIRKKLEEPAEKMEFFDTPLRDVVARIQDLHDIPVQIDAKALEDAGLDLDAPITRDIADVSLRSALHLLLGDLNLAYIVTNEVLMITTEDKAAENLQVVLYPATEDYDTASLIDVVQNIASPQTWNTVGGPGSIQPAGRFLCVSQTEEVHDEIRQFLERLCDNEFLQLDGSEAAVKQRVVTRIHPVVDPKVLGELGVKLVSICNTALGAEGDPSAKVFVVGDRLVVQSTSRGFHIYAADVVSAFNGVEVTTLERFESHGP
jgi:hypothetical protein